MAGGFSGWGDGHSPPTSPKGFGVEGKLGDKPLLTVTKASRHPPMKPRVNIHHGISKRGPLSPNATTKLMLPEPHRTFAVEPTLPSPVAQKAPLRDATPELPRLPPRGKPGTAPAGQLRVVRQDHNRRVVTVPRRHPWSVARGEFTPDAARPGEHPHPGIQNQAWPTPALRPNGGGGGADDGGRNRTSATLTAPPATVSCDGD